MALLTATGALTGLGSLVAGLGGGALAGVGAGIGSSLESGAKKEAAEISNKGPVRGGSERAGNKGAVALASDPSTLEKLGQTTLPLRNPVYGPPIDFDSLYQPQKFGSGYSVGANRPQGRFA